MVRRVERTRNDGTMTESQYWSHIRSALRRAFRYWKPIQRTKMEARRPYRGSEKRRKWEYQCSSCGNWFPDKEVEVDHIIPVGTLKCGDDLKGFVERLSTEDGYQVLCKSCHKEKTQKERKI